MSKKKRNARSSAESYLHFKYKKKEDGYPFIDSVGDEYDHPTGTYNVDWVCGCGDYDDGETCLGLCGEAMTWTGTIADLATAGFKKKNKQDGVK